VTRRIAVAILLTSWAILLLGGAASYALIRGVLLAELDDSLVLRASSLPEVMGVRQGATAPAVPAGDRYVIKNHLGQTLARPPAEAAGGREARVASKSFATLADGTRTRTVAVAFPAAGAAPALTVIYGGSAARYDQLLTRMAWVLVGLVGGAGVIVAAVAVWVARVAMRPLRSAAATLATMDDRTLDRRLDVAALPPEMRPVGERMNQLLARLEAGMRERKRFLVDAAHELRTPVAALTTTMEVALRRPREVPALVRTLNDCLGDARLLRRLVEALLDQFRLDATPGPAAVSDVDVSALLDLCADTVESGARLKGVTVVRAYGAGVRFVTQPERLRSVVSNLLSNGVEYNRAGGEVRLGCEVGDGGLRVTVSDDGPGILEEDRAHVFEPFYRARAVTPAADGHAGLGLYLVKSHVEALGGACRLDSELGRGTRFVIELPPLTTGAGKATDISQMGSESHRVLTAERIKG
jgi:signal transduction histidine kinase